MDGEHNVAVLELPSLAGTLNDETPEDNTATDVQESAVAVSEKKKYIYLFVKRSFDLFRSLLALVILSPVFLVVAILIKREDGGTVLHRRVCVGKNGKTYIMYKFRTMMPNADDRLDLFTPQQREDYLRGVKIEDDPRITKIGRVLRSTSIDELSQLISVLRSDMSLIGPRPVIEREAEEYGKLREHLLSCKPGITGYWQVMGRGSVPFLSEEGKRLQLYYVDHKSLWLDIKILFKTVFVVISKVGAR